MIFCNTLLYSSSPFLSPLPSIRSKPSRFSKRVLTVQVQFQSMDQNDLLLRQKFMEFPYVSPTRRELMVDLMSTLEDRLHSQLLPCTLPTDVRNFKNPNGSAEASLHIRSGEKSSPVQLCFSVLGFQIWVLIMIRLRNRILMRSACWFQSFSCMIQTEPEFSFVMN